MNDSSKFYDLLNELLGKRKGETPLPMRPSDFQMANKFSECFLLKL